jgi:hypothetical protein
VSGFIRRHLDDRADERAENAFEQRGKRRFASCSSSWSSEGTVTPLPGSAKILWVRRLALIVYVETFTGCFVEAFDVLAGSQNSTLIRTMLLLRAL